MIRKVSLVGAGPGDPKLLTVKALELIREADLIIYDYLVNLKHLCFAKATAKKIGVGKGFRHHRLSQQRINRMILEAARKGKKVVRLKGGDPYLFGRGGEEALYLFKHKVPFEVVPGVTSATACAAYCGIPLTHRDHNAAVTFLTGHRADDENLDSIEWKKIIALNGTLAIYMGLYNLSKIVAHLRKSGMPAHTKIAVIEWGTLPRQKSCVGTLGSIEVKAERKGLKPPSMIIIGEVVSLHDKLNWYERLPLFGKKVVITRARGRAGLLRERLEDLGAEVLEFPLIEIAPLKDFSRLDKAIGELSGFQWLVFTSQEGVDAFFKRLETLKKDARILANTRVASVGSATTLALKKQGVRADLEPSVFETKALAAAFKKRFKGLRGQRVMLLRTHIANAQLEDDLKKLGASVNRVTAYFTRSPKGVSSELKKVLLSGSADYVTFTSASTVQHFVRCLGESNAKKIAKKTRFVSIGPVTSKALKDYGLKPYGQAKIYNLEGLVEILK